MIVISLMECLSSMLLKECAFGHINDIQGLINWTMSSYLGLMWIKSNQYSEMIVSGRENSIGPV